MSAGDARSSKPAGVKATTTVTTTGGANENTAAAVKAAKAGKAASPATVTTKASSSTTPLHYQIHSSGSDADATAKAPSKAAAAVVVKTAAAAAADKGAAKTAAVAHPKAVLNKSGFVKAEVDAAMEVDEEGGANVDLDGNVVMNVKDTKGEKLSYTVKQLQALQKKHLYKITGSPTLKDILILERTDKGFDSKTDHLFSSELYGNTPLSQILDQLNKNEVKISDIWQKSSATPKSKSNSKTKSAKSAAGEVETLQEEEIKASLVGN